jgi:hypothetical protein
MTAVQRSHATLRIGSDHTKYSFRSNNKLWSTNYTKLQKCHSVLHNRLSNIPQMLLFQYPTCRFFFASHKPDCHRKQNFQLADSSCGLPWRSLPRFTDTGVGLDHMFYLQSTRNPSQLMMFVITSTSDYWHNFRFLTTRFSRIPIVRGHGIFLLQKLCVAGSSRAGRIGQFLMLEGMA